MPSVRQRATREGMDLMAVDSAKFHRSAIHEKLVGADLDLTESDALRDLLQHPAAGGELDVQTIEVWVFRIPLLRSGDGYAHGCLGSADWNTCRINGNAGTGGIGEGEFGGQILGEIRRGARHFKSHLQRGIFIIRVKIRLDLERGEMHLGERKEFDRTGNASQGMVGVFGRAGQLVRDGVAEDGKGDGIGGAHVDGIGDIELEGSESPGVLSDGLAIHPDLAIAVHRVAAQYEALSLPVLGDVKRSPVTRRGIFWNIESLHGPFAGHLDRVPCGRRSDLVLKSVLR